MEDTIKTIKESVIKATGIDWETLISDTRVQSVADARALFCYIAYNKTNLSFGQVGKLVNRDHATAVHYKHKLEDLLCNKDSQISRLYDEIYKLMEEHGRPAKDARRVYISGAIAGLDIDERKKAFFLAEETLTAWGYKPVNPFRNGVPQSAHWRVHMRADIRLLLNCDKIYMLRGWELSKGAKLELDVASSCGIDVMFE